MPVDYRRLSDVIVKQSTLLAGNEFLHAVDAAQLEDGISHGRFEQNGKVAAGCDRNDHLADRHAKYFLRLRVERQTRCVGAGERFLQVDDQFELHLAA